MTKKGTLIGSIVCFLFIAIMIPIAIFASTNKEYINSSNYVKYNVVDLQGDFFLALIGNTPDSNSNSTDIGSTRNESEQDILVPAQLFTAKYDSVNDTYTVYNVYGTDTETPTTNNIVEFPGVNNIEFNKTHYSISYYFVFINTATNNIDLNDDRDVYISTHSDSIENLTTTWSYVLGSTSNPNASTFILPNTGWQIANEKSVGFIGDKIVVDARDNTSQNYNYAILKFNMSVDPESLTNIDSQFTISITLESASIQ